MSNGFFPPTSLTVIGMVFFKKKYSDWGDVTFQSSFIFHLLDSLCDMQLYRDFACVEGHTWGHGWEGEEMETNLHENAQWIKVLYMLMLNFFKDEK